MNDAATFSGTWLLLSYSLPKNAASLRLKLARRLQRLGAVALRGALYVLPNQGPTRDDFSWLAREIEREGGKAFLCEARAVEGLTDRQLIEEFNAARAADYAALAEDARRTLQEATALLGAEGEESAAHKAEATAIAARLKEQLAEVAAIDFFGAPGRLAVDEALGELEGRLAPPRLRSGAVLQGCVWVTHRHWHADCLASAWLIQRFFDAGARFRFLVPEAQPLAAGEVRFATGQRTFSPDEVPGTFEGLVRFLGLENRALRSLAVIVQDLAREAGPFARPESSGLALVLAGMEATCPDPEARRLRGFEFFDELFEALQRLGAERAEDASAPKAAKGLSAPGSAARAFP